MRRWVIIVLSILVVGGVGTAVVLRFVRSTSSWARSLSWSDPSLAEVGDGEYIGSASLAMPAGTAAANTRATARVTVRDHRYASIEVTDPEPIAKSMTAYAQSVVEHQSVRPDVITGATVTKSVVLMAVANAVENH